MPASVWTEERLAELSREELTNLQANAARLGEAELAARCAALVKGAAARGAPAGKPNRRKLMSRGRAFAARGVYLKDERTSWSGVRKADGMVVVAIWQAAVQLHGGACACLLWAPNDDGGRPWSDTAAGRERLEHCRLAAERGGAEALLVYGEALAGRLPEDRARTVLGLDTESPIRLRVERNGEEYWARWGGKQAAI